MEFSGDGWEKWKEVEEGGGGKGGERKTSGPSSTEAITSPSSKRDSMGLGVTLRPVGTGEKDRRGEKDE